MPTTTKFKDLRTCRRRARLRSCGKLVPNGFEGMGKEEAFAARFVGGRLGVRTVRKLVALQERFGMPWLGVLSLSLAVLHVAFFGEKEVGNLAERRERGLRDMERVVRGEVTLAELEAERSAERLKAGEAKLGPVVGSVGTRTKGRSTRPDA